MIYLSIFYRMVGLSDSVVDPSPYQLLGLENLEADPDRIRRALASQKRLLRFATAAPQFVPVVLRFDRELDHAASVLLDPTRRRAVDERLARGDHDPALRRSRNARERLILSVRQSHRSLANEDGSLAEARRPRFADSLRALAISDQDVLAILQECPYPPAPAPSSPTQEAVKFFVAAIDLCLDGGSLAADDESKLQGLGRRLGVPISYISEAVETRLRALNARRSGTNEAMLRERFREVVRVLFPHGVIKESERRDLFNLAAAQGLSEEAAAEVLDQHFRRSEVDTVGDETLPPAPAVDRAAATPLPPVRVAALPAADKLPWRYWGLTVRIAVVAVIVIGLAVLLVPLYRLATKSRVITDEDDRVPATGGSKTASPTALAALPPTPTSPPAASPTPRIRIGNPSGSLKGPRRPINPDAQPPAPPAFNIGQASALCPLPKAGDLADQLRIEPDPKVPESFVVSCRSHQTGRFQTLLRCSLSPSAPGDEILLWQVDDKAAVEHPDDLGHLVLEAYDPRDRILYQCSVKRNPQVLLLVAELDDQAGLKSEPVRFSYPWPTCLQVRTTRSTEGGRHLANPAPNVPYPFGQLDHGSQAGPSGSPRETYTFSLYRDVEDLTLTYVFSFVVEGATVSAAIGTDPLVEVIRATNKEKDEVIAQRNSTSDKIRVLQQQISALQKRVDAAGKANTKNKAGEKIAELWHQMDAVNAQIATVDRTIQRLRTEMAAVSAKIPGAGDLERMVLGQRLADLRSDVESSLGLRSSYIAKLRRLETELRKVGPQLPNDGFNTWDALSRITSSQEDLDNLLATSQNLDRRIERLERRCALVGAQFAAIGDLEIVDPWGIRVASVRPVYNGPPPPAAPQPAVKEAQPPAP